MAQMSHNIIALYDYMYFSEEQLVKTSHAALDTSKLFRKKTVLLKKNTGGWEKW